MLFEAGIKDAIPLSDDLFEMEIAVFNGYEILSRANYFNQKDFLRSS